MMELTILTPTFNREEQLKDLFQSLQAQTSKDFEWLIIDDGSMDHTKAVVDGFKDEAGFPIQYMYKENGGKHTALNMGIKGIISDLTFIVDSDDKLTPDAVGTILKYHNKYRNQEGLCGYSFLRLFPDGKVNGMPFKKEEWIASFIESRVNSGDTNSDKAEVYYTRVLKVHPFPEYPGEKFLGEDIVWVRIARKYEMVHINKGIYIGTYLEGGLTNNRRRHNIKSPLGCVERAKEFMKRDMNVKTRLKAALQYVIYGHLAGMDNHELLRDSPFKALVMMAIPPGNVLYVIWNRKYNSA